MTTIADAHDHGLIHDLSHMSVLSRQAIGRRRTLRLLLSAGGAAMVSACGGSDASGSVETTSSTTTTTNTTTTSTTGTTSTSSESCIADPTETNGPYPADGSNSVNGSVVNALDDNGIVRADIRSSFGTASGTAAGIYM